MFRNSPRLRLRTLIRGLGVAGLVVVAGSPAGGDEAELKRPFVPAVSMDKDRRVAPADFARQAGLDSVSLRGQLGATGLVRCGAATGTGQLTLRNDVITTAAHVLIDQFGKHRVGCVFEPLMAGAGGAVPLDYASITTGSSKPLVQPATRDWAVARLTAPVANVEPYGVGMADSMPLPVLMCAGGNKQIASIGTERCTTRKIIGRSSDGIRELAIDCNAGPGSSGAALVSGNKIVGIYVGYRSNDPGKAQAFSTSHYNFAISIEGPFRRALYAALQR